MDCKRIYAVRTVGGRSLVIKIRSEERITVNDVPVTQIISVGDNQVNTSASWKCIHL